MATSTLGTRAHGRPTRTREQEELHIEADHGPWLFLSAPLSLAATIVVIAWLSLTTLP